MIDIFIPGSKESKWRQSSSQVSYKENNPPFNTLPVVASIQAESRRRDSICKRLAAQCGYKAGDTVVPVNPTAEEQGKEFKVLSICDSYALLGRNEKWPDNDNPLLVHCMCLDKDDSSTFFCTTNYLVKRS